MTSWEFSNKEGLQMIMSHNVVHTMFEAIPMHARSLTYDCASSRRILFILNRLKNARSVVVARIFQESPWGALMIKKIPRSAEAPKRPIVVIRSGFLSRLNDAFMRLSYHCRFFLAHAIVSI